MRAALARNLTWAAVTAALVGVGAYGLSGALEGIDLGSASQPAAAPQPSPSAATTGGAAAPATAAPTQPAVLQRFDPAASDAANLALFKRTLEHAASSTPSSATDTATLTGALAAAGFDASRTQRSTDRTSANLQAPTLTVAVRLRGSCLIGQYVRSDATVSAEAAAPISTGACLIGRQPAA